MRQFSIRIVEILCLLMLVSLLTPSAALARTAISPTQEKAAELVLMGGNVFTVDQARPQAEAIAISRSRIVAVGTNEAVKKHIGDETKVIDLNGRFVMPGFIEGHAHFVGLGESMMMLNLHTAKTWDDIVEQVSEAAKTTPPGEWIVGRGWHQSKWERPPANDVDGYPTSAEIDAVSPDHPVLLTHASGHMSFANGYAMRLAGVDAATKNPTGG